MPFSVSVEVAVVSFVRPPAPEVTPERVCVALLEYSSVPLSPIAPAQDPAPSEPAPPICSVPARIVVLQVKVFTPESVTVPAVVLETAPVAHA
jgi:hypothetical protein